MKTALCMFWHLPTWLLMKLFAPFFPKTHPWNATQSTLLYWSEHASGQLHYFDLIFWLGILAVVTAIIRLARR